MIPGRRWLVRGRVTEAGDFLEPRGCENFSAGMLIHITMWTSTRTKHRKNFSTDSRLS
jgi:hypothetical protein